MRIGDPVLHRGRRLILVGVDPMSVPDRLAEVADPVTLERFLVPFDELEEEPRPPQGFDPAA